MFCKTFCSWSTDIKKEEVFTSIASPVQPSAQKAWCGTKHVAGLESAGRDSRVPAQCAEHRREETLPTVKHLVYSGVPSWSLLTRFFFSLVHADSKEGGHKSCLYLWRALGSCSGMQTDSLMSCILGTTTASCQGL